MENSILEKLEQHLKTGISREADVVYLMVEIRKVIDQEIDEEVRQMKESLYSLLKFYCDWVVHSEKDGITREIEAIMARIGKELFSSQQIWLAEGSSNLSFIYMNELKKQLRSFLGDFGLDKEILKEERWVSFVQLLIDVLIDQPVNFSKYNEKNRKKGIVPTHNIKSFSFRPAAKGAVIWSIEFLDGSEMKFGNAF